MLWYLAMPVKALADETLAGNLAACAKVWRALLNAGIRVTAPHCGLCQALDDTDPHERALGLSVGLTILARCDGLILAGPRLSTGMQREHEVAVLGKLAVVNAVGIDTDALVEAVNVTECVAELETVTTKIPI